MWLWPVLKFWRYSPQGLLLAVIWNFCELFKLKMPMTEKAFSIICGCKGEKQ